MKKPVSKRFPKNRRIHQEEQQMLKAASKEQNKQKQIIAYCKVCEDPIWGYPGSTQDLCYAHLQERLMKKLLEIKLKR